MNLCRRALTAGVAACLLPGLAQAHLVSTGLGPVYDGIGHFFLSAESILPVLPLLLLAGMGTAAQARQSLAGWLLGCLGGYLFGAAVGVGSGVAASAQWVTFIPALALLGGGAVLAFDAGYARRTRVLLIAAGGALLGFGEAQALQALPEARLLMLGTLLSLLVVSSLVPAAVLAFVSGPAWYRLSVRVAGSWLAGIGLLLVGWNWRNGLGS